MEINLAGEIKNSLANGEGIRYVIFVQGCSHKCPECQNSHTWSTKKNITKSIEEIVESISEEIPIVKGVTISGGEPLDQAEQIYFLCKEIKEKLNLNIWIYTGYVYEDIIKSENEYKRNIFKYIDTLVDGRFDINKMDNSLKYTGSNNQRLLYFINGELNNIKSSNVL